jgi:DNA-binding XRE family transcriptional regulator
MSTAMKPVTVLAPQQESHSALAMLPRGAEFKLILDSPNLKDVKNLFIAISATALPEVAEIVKLTNETKLLRVLFIREDVPSEWLPQMLARADLRMVRNILVHSQTDWATPFRVIRAWRVGGQHDLIARADVIVDSLLVLNCALQAFEVPFNKIPALKNIPKAERANFRISDSGSYIHWDAGDIHLDIDDIRYVVDAHWQKKCDLERVTHNKNFGRAIAAVRKKHKLGQAEIHGVSERQLRRIEKEGARPSVKTLSTLATAHNMETNDYLNELAKNL